MNRFVARTALVAAALLTMTAVAAPAHADLGLDDPPVTLSSAGENAFVPQVAVAPDGTIVTTWYGDSSQVVQIARSMDAGATWQAPVNVSALGGGGWNPHLAVAGDGTIAVTWSGSGFAQVATSTDSGATWNAPLNISAVGQNPQDPWIFATSASTFAVTWESNNSSVQAAVSTDSGVTWSTPSIASPPGGSTDASAPMVAGNGTIFAIWTLNNVVQTSRSTDGGATWSVPASLSAGGKYNPRLAASPDGTVTATWQGFGGISSVISTSRSTDGGATWSPPFNLSVDGLDSNNARIAVAANGTIAVTWERGNGPTERIVQAATSTNSGASWSVPANLSAFGFYSDNPQIVVNGDGEFTVTWERDNLSAVPPNSVVEVATLARAGATWTAPLQVSPESGFVYEVQLAVGPSGRVTVAWQHDDGFGSNTAQATTLRYSLAPAAAASGLAAGGFDVAPLGLAGVVLLALGAALVRARRHAASS